MSTNYKAAVAEARQLVKRSEDDQWRLAELTWQQLGREDMTTRQWGEDVGISAGHASMLRKVWAVFLEYKPSDRPSFADAYAQAKGMPVERSERREMEAVASIRKASPERKAEIVRELVEADPVVAIAASRALEARQAAAPTPKVRERTKDVRFAQAMQAMRGADRFLRDFADAASGGEWNDTEASAFEGALDGMVGTIDVIRAALRSGSWDEELAKLTTGGAL